MKLVLCVLLSVCVLSLTSAKRYEGRYHGKHARRGGNTCKTMCLQFVSEIQRRVEAIEILTDKPAENSTILKPYGEEFCKLRAPGSPICQGLMRSHRDIFDGIVKGVKAETICKKIPLCSPRRFRPRKDKKKRRGDRKPLNWSPKKRCDICRATIQIVDSSLAIFNYTELEIDKLVMLSCKFMSSWGSVQKECENIVRQVERVERLLMKDLSPGDVCAVLGYCNYSKESVDQTAECGIAGKVASMSPFRLPLVL
uniref:J3-crystallin n=1 Tax=Tripedalia cystophora TaxID=6141 RepID=Q9GU96_TRICY|nr:J3-crystallin [Tripedalia cystophora]